MFSYNFFHLDIVEKLQSPLFLKGREREGGREGNRDRGRGRERERQGGSWTILVHSEVEETYFSNVFPPIQIPITDALNSQAPSICNSISSSMWCWHLLQCRYYSSTCNFSVKLSFVVRNCELYRVGDQTLESTGLPAARNLMSLSWFWYLSIFSSLTPRFLLKIFKGT